MTALSLGWTTLMHARYCGLDFSHGAALASIVFGLFGCAGAGCACSLLEISQMSLKQQLL
jgi:hypothetical protein